jgi:hypothetical protein
MEYILFLLILRVCSLSSTLKEDGSVVSPVESAMRTRRDVNWAMKRGRARRGLEDTFSSSKQTQYSRAGGRAPRKLADMSRANNVMLMVGRIVVRKAGKAPGLLEEPISKWVVPAKEKCQEK